MDEKADRQAAFDDGKAALGTVWACRSTEAPLRCCWKTKCDGIFENGVQASSPAFIQPRAMTRRRPMTAQTLHNGAQHMRMCETCAELLCRIGSAASRVAVAARLHMAVGVGLLGFRLGHPPCYDLVCVEIAYGKPDRSSRRRAANTTCAAGPMACLLCSCMGWSGHRACVWAGSGRSLASEDL